MVEGWIQFIPSPTAWPSLSMSVQQRQKLHDHLGWRYGIPASLSSARGLIIRTLSHLVSLPVCLESRRCRGHGGPVAIADLAFSHETSQQKKAKRKKKANRWKHLLRLRVWTFEVRLGIANLCGWLNFFPLISKWCLDVCFVYTSGIKYVAKIIRATPNLELSV